MKSATPDTTKQLKMFNDSQISIDYMAGLFDGEGNFTAQKHTESFVPTFIIQLGTTKEIEPNLFKNRFGGSVTQNEYSNENWSTLYLWRITGHKARVCAEELLPNLMGKREQCELFIEAQTLKDKHRTNGVGYSEKLVEQLVDYHDELREFNANKTRGI